MPYVFITCRETDSTEVVDILNCILDELPNDILFGIRLEGHNIPRQFGSGYLYDNSNYGSLILSTWDAPAFFRIYNKEITRIVLT